MLQMYDRIAGQSSERLAALSDGVFAISMTLLVLDLRAPAAEAIHSEMGLVRALVEVLPRLLVYVMSFLTLGIFWVGQQTQLNYLSRSDRSLTWVHLVFLFFVSITPFSTSLLAEHLAYRTALFVYWLNILALGVTLYWAWTCAEATNLIRNDLPPDVPIAIKHRLVITQVLYAAAACLCFVSTYLSIGIIVLMQLRYAIGFSWRREKAAAKAAS